MNKLDHKVFDEIYEACKDGGKWEDTSPYDPHVEFYAEFQYWLWAKRKPLWESVWETWKRNGGENIESLDDACLEAYHDGEIRDRGAMEQLPFRVRITKARSPLSWYADKIGQEFTVVEGEDYDDFYSVPNSQRYVKHEDCEIVDPLWYKLDPAEFDGLVDNPRMFSYRVYERRRDVWDTFKEIVPEDAGATKRGNIMIPLYRAGIIRKGGAMGKSEPRKLDYTHAFSVKGGQMRVDWDKLEVTKENALEISIASWKWAYEWMQDNGEMLSRHGNVCALCNVYGTFLTCDDCPVALAAGKHCANTPYQKYDEATTLHEALDACRDEIAFLEGLR